MIQTGVIYGLGTMLGFGFADFLAKKAISRSGYITGILYIQMAGMIPLLLYPENSTNQSANTSIFGASLITSTAYAFTMLAFFRRIGVGKLSIISPLGSSWPLLVIPFGIVVLGEYLTASQIIGAIFATAGILLTAYQPNKVSLADSESGAKYGLLAMLGSAVMFIFIKLFVRDFSPVLLALVMRPLAAAMVFSYALCIKKRPKIAKLSGETVVGFARNISTLPSS